jgi:hypothetical protein
MSDTFELIVEQASKSFTRFCIDEQRYRVAWLTGTPYTGKSTLARQLQTRNAWGYLNYTLETGYFDQLADTVQSYQPETFIVAIKQWCEQCSCPVLIIDELDGLLATWSVEQRRAWASEASRLRELACGLILVTSFFDLYSLRSFAPNQNQPQVINLPGVMR